MNEGSEGGFGEGKRGEKEGADPTSRDSREVGGSPGVWGEEWGKATEQKLLPFRFFTGSIWTCVVFVSMFSS